MDFFNFISVQANNTASSRVLEYLNTSQLFRIIEQYAADFGPYNNFVPSARMLGYRIVVKVTQKCHKISHKRL